MEWGVFNGTSRPSRTDTESLFHRLTPFHYWKQPVSSQSDQLTYHIHWQAEGRPALFNLQKSLFVIGIKMRIVISASQNWLVKCLVSPLILIRAARSNLKCDYWKHPRILSAFTPWAHPVSVEGSAHSAWTRPPRSKSTPSFLLSRRRCHLRPNQPAAPARQPRRPVCELGSHHRHGHITTPCLGVHSYSRKMILFSWPCWTYCPGLDSPPSRVFLSWHSCSLLHPDPLPTTAQ